MELAKYLDAERGRAMLLAQALKVPRSLVAIWKGGRQVPAERCPEIELVTRGKVTCEELRPDVKWWVLRQGLPEKGEA